MELLKKQKIRRYEKMEELIELLEEIQPDAEFLIPLQSCLL